MDWSGIVISAGYVLFTEGRLTENGLYRTITRAIGQIRRKMPILSGGEVLSVPL